MKRSGFPGRFRLETIMERPRLLYFADTMCSWCYGFAPEMGRIATALGERAEVLLFSGGLRPFNREPMDQKMREFLAGVYRRIHGVTGQPFGEKAMNRAEGFVYDTEPASRAVVTMRHLAPGKDYPFMLAIQRAFYAEGEDITRAEALASHTEAFGVTRAAFLEAFESEAMKQATLGDFQVAKQLGVDGFPTLVLHRKNASGEDELLLLSKGYSKAEDVMQRLETAMKPAAAA